MFVFKFKAETRYLPANSIKNIALDYSRLDTSTSRELKEYYVLQCGIFI